MSQVFKGLCLLLRGQTPMEISAGVGGYQQPALGPTQRAAGAVGESADAIYLG